jgi:hypothetical protein
MNIQPLSQRDPAWRLQPLGRSLETIGGYGCAITALAMLLNASLSLEDDHPIYDPIIINTTLKIHTNGFVNRNFVNWPVLSDIWPYLKYSGRIDCPTRPASPDQLREIDKRLAADVPVIIYVDAQAHEPGLQQHFVLVTGTLAADYVIADPWDGATVALCKRYGNTPEIAVCGIMLLDFDVDWKLKRIS